MNLFQYIKKRSISLHQVEKELALTFGASPSIATLSRINEGATPGLEVALMLQHWSEGDVKLEDLIGTRTYTVRRVADHKLIGDKRRASAARAQEIDSLMSFLEEEGDE